MELQNEPFTLFCRRLLTGCNHRARAAAASLSVLIEVPLGVFVIEVLCFSLLADHNTD